MTDKAKEAEKAEEQAAEAARAETIENIQIARAKVPQPGVKDHRLDPVDGEEEVDNGKQSFPLHDVLVDRDKTKIMVHVPEHEIPVLEAIHGQARITDTGESDFDIELPRDAQSELERLRTKYRQPNRPDVVSQVFHNGAADLKGFEYDKSSRPAKAPQNAVHDNRKKAARAK